MLARRFSVLLKQQSMAARLPAMMCWLLVSKCLLFPDIFAKKSKKQ